MISYKSYAYDIAVENADGVTIYYNYINDGTELEVTSRNSYYYGGSVVIPEEVSYMSRTIKVTSIGYKAFYRGGLTSISIPNSVTNIGDEAFSDCTSLTSVSIPNSVTSISNCAFYYCESLTSVTIPNSVTSLGNYAFAWCTNLTSITIPNSVTSIGFGTFRNCSSLSSITIPNSVTSIDNYAFEDCHIQKVISKIENPFDLYTYTFSNYTFYNASLYVPAGTIEKYNTTKGWKRFSYIEELGSGEDTGNTEKDGLSFRITSSNECEVVRYDGHSDYVEIPEHVISNGKEYMVTSIGEKAFFACEISSVAIPNTVTNIGENAFNGCYYLSSVIIPNSVTSIGRKAFYRCKSMASLTIGNSVTSIGELAFGECRSLTTLTIPNSVTSIGASAFSGDEKSAPNIQTVISLITTPFEILGKSSYSKNEYTGVFTQNTFNKATLYIPKGTIDKYKATDGWKDFAHIEENNGETGILSIVSENETNTIYSIKGNSLQCPSKGINIIKMKNGTAKKVLIK